MRRIKKVILLARELFGQIYDDIKRGYGHRHR